MNNFRINCNNCKHKNYCRKIRDFTKQHFRWTFHNLIGHPLSEIAYILGFKKLSNFIHEKTIPKPVKKIYNDSKI